MVRADVRGLVEANPARPALRPDQDSLARLVAGWQGKMVGGKTDSRCSQVRRKGARASKSGKFLIGKTKFGGVQEVVCAALRNRDTLLDCCKQPRKNSARSCACWFRAVDNLPEQLLRPCRRAWGFKPHLLAVDRAPERPAMVQTQSVLWVLPSCAGALGALNVCYVGILLQSRMKDTRFGI